MNKIEAKKELINICKKINALLDKKYIVFNSKNEAFPTESRFTFQEDGIYLKYNENCSAFYLLGEDSGTSTYGYNSYLHEIQAAKKEIMKLKFIAPENIISIKSLITK